MEVKRRVRSTSSSLEVEVPRRRRQKKKEEQIIQNGTNAVRVSSGIDLVGKEKLKKALRRSMRRRQGTQTDKLMCSPNVFV